MAQVEYQGIKVGGSKWLMILPLIGTLVGGLWGGFELYNRLLLAEGKLQKINPTAIMAEVETLRSVSEVIKEELRIDIDMVIADVERLEDSVNGVEDLIREVDDTTAETQREVRNDVYEIEIRMQDRFRDTDDQLREMRDDLEDRIEQILENPLNDVE
jgi:glutamine synthetase type III